MDKCLKIMVMVTISLLVGACSGVKLSQWHFPYMMEVQQGNYITNDQYKQLKIGMTKEQVSYIIGMPLSQYMFDQNRWDYIYQDNKNNDLKKNYSVTILFDKNSKAVNISKTGEFFAK
ncbi:MAG: hypothetical protein K0R94_32 [Burkholderiales bacterium]|jgi:outer membrane protein assembly factor BamE|nr:hypothetical protein [Burkholderiales bacterium]